MFSLMSNYHGVQGNLQKITPCTVDVIAVGDRDESASECVH